MPSKVLESYAKKSGKSLQTVEKKWDECKVAADKKFKDKEKDGAYWGFVNNCTKNKLGLLDKAEESILNKW